MFDIDGAVEEILMQKRAKEEAQQTWILYEERDNYKEYYSKEDPSFHRADWVDDKGNPGHSSWKEYHPLPGYQEWSEQIAQDDYDNGHIDLGDEKYD